jgi:hypothetical protein
MKQSDIVEEPHRVPKGLRYGYAINALNKGVQLNLVSKRMATRRWKPARFMPML